MTRTRAFPFLRITDGRVESSAWQIRLGSESGSLPGVLPHWDYNTDLQLARTIVIDEAGVRSDCGLSANARIDLVTVWRSSGTALRGRSEFIEIGSARQNAEFVLNAAIPGSQLAVDVTVNTQLVLSSRGTGARGIAASVPGTVLWEDATTVTLEGTASRFPVEPRDFASATWLPYSAGWYLNWNSRDLHLPFLRNVRLFVNEAHPAVVAAVSNLNPTAQQAAIQSAMYYDIGRQLVRGALNNEDFRENADSYPEGSTGYAILGIISTHLPGDRPRELFSTMESRPEFFDALLQGAFNLFSPPA